MKSEKGTVNQRRRGKELEKLESKKLNFKNIITILLLLLIIIIGYVYFSKLMKKDIIKVKPKKPLFTSYPFKSTNPRYDLLKHINKWLSKKTLIKTNPPDWPGEQGKGVKIPKNMKEVSDKRFKENQFNIVASEMIALDRTIPDGRVLEYRFILLQIIEIYILFYLRCLIREYPDNLPSTSIIIVHHNEGNSTLLRTLVSIMNQTPLQFITEIILIDDASKDRGKISIHLKLLDKFLLKSLLEYLKKPLDDFVATLPVKVVVLRNEKRIGLMKSRIRGAAVATGDTMTFLDAHVECNVGWLEPLLTEIKHNR